MAPADVYCHHHTQQTIRLATKPKMPIFRPNNNTKNYTYLIQIICSNNLFKNEKSTFTANLKVRPWYLTGSFPLNAFRGLYFSHFIRPSLAYLTLPRSRPKRILGNSAIARPYNSCSLHFMVFFFNKNLTSEQHSANCSCMTLYFSYAFGVTNAHFVREFNNTTRSACIHFVRTHLRIYI